MKYKLKQGDNIELLKKMPDNSVDAVVTDPPYGLSFMGKKWDYDVPSVELWKEVYRVLKPGGHVLSFGGTRTYHRMVVNIEDAGFEIRDQIMWLYGSGFPKSHNIGKAVDKLQGNEREVVGDNPNHRTSTGLLELGFQDGKVSSTLTKGSSPYEGWGTALKPSNEPICVARKPLSEKSVAENVLKWGTGGINIDGCRIDLNGDDTSRKISGANDGIFNSCKVVGTVDDKWKEGRFPANIILECICDEVIKGEKTTIKTNINNKEANWFRNAGGDTEDRWSFNDKGDIHTNPMCPCRLLDEQSGYLKSGGASRFFYQAKVSKKERNMGLDNFEEKVIEGRDKGQDERNVAYKARPSSRANTHPTVKPVSLMAYLCRLITPPGGTILDPYMGSGSTGIAALLEGFNFIGFELDPDYVKIAEARIKNYEKYREFLKK